MSHISRRAAVRQALFPTMILGTLMAMGQENPPPAGYHEHDGFFLSMGLGPLTASYDDKVSGNAPFAGSTLTFSGWGALFDVRIGGSIGTNLILSGDLIGRSLVEPKLEINGGGSATLEDVTFTEALVGAGLTYYLMPENIFFSATLGLSNISLDYYRSGTRVTGTTDTGFGVNVKVGKEWWVGDDWALGIAGSGSWMSLTNKPSGATEDFTGYSFSVQFSATYH